MFLHDIAKNILFSGGSILRIFINIKTVKWEYKDYRPETAIPKKKQMEVESYAGDLLIKEHRQSHFKIKIG